MKKQKEKRKINKLRKESVSSYFFQAQLQLLKINEELKDYFEALPTMNRLCSKEREVYKRLKMIGKLIKVGEKKIVLEEKK